MDTAPAEDGLIARVRLPGGRVTAAGLRALAEGARDLGDGEVGLTSRANAQLRGLGTGAADRLAPVLSRAGLIPSPAHDRARNILASPLAGRDPAALADADAIVTALDAGLCADPELAALPGRFAFAVDDGGLPTASSRHDVALVAVAEDELALLLAGIDTGVRVPGRDAADVALAAARTFLRLREQAGNGAWHVRELPGGAAAFGYAPVAAPVAPRGGPGPLGVAGARAQADGRVALCAIVPLGSLTQRHLALLTGLIEDEGARVRVAPWRGVVVGDVPAGRAGVVASALADAGLDVDAGSPWRGVSACSGLGRCRRALADVRGAAARAPRPEGAATAVHWAGCERRCGRPAGAATVTALGAGAYEITLARREPVRAAHEGEVHELLRSAAAVTDEEVPWTSG